MKTATYFEEVFNETEDFMSSMITEITSQGGFEFNELKVWNASMAFYNSMKQTCLEWARDQDKSRNALDEKLDRISIQNKELAYELIKIQIELAKH